MSRLSCGTIRLHGMNTEAEKKSFEGLMYQAQSGALVHWRLQITLAGVCHTPREVRYSGFKVMRITVSKSPRRR